MAVAEILANDLSTTASGHRAKERIPERPFCAAAYLPTGILAGQRVGGDENMRSCRPREQHYNGASSWVEEMIVYLLRERINSLPLTVWTSNFLP